LFIANFNYILFPIKSKKSKFNIFTVYIIYISNYSSVKILKIVWWKCESTWCERNDDLINTRSDEMNDMIDESQLLERVQWFLINVVIDARDFTLIDRQFVMPDPLFFFRARYYIRTIPLCGRETPYHHEILADIMPVSFLLFYLCNHNMKSKRRNTKWLYGYMYGLRVRTFCAYIVRMIITISALNIMIRQSRLLG